MSIWVKQSSAISLIYIFFIEVFEIFEWLICIGSRHGSQRKSRIQWPQSRKERQGHQSRTDSPSKLTAETIENAVGGDES